MGEVVALPRTSPANVPSQGYPTPAQLRILRPQPAQLDTFGLGQRSIRVASRFEAFHTQFRAAPHQPQGRGRHELWALPIPSRSGPHPRGAQNRTSFSSTPRPPKSRMASTKNEGKGKSATRPVVQERSLGCVGESLPLRPGSSPTADLRRYIRVHAPTDQ